jgi:phage terminase small subunit
MARLPRHRYAADATAVEDVETRAARLGITPERVLREYARIGFSDMSRIVEWDDAGKMQAKPSTGLSEDDAPAIAEIVASASTNCIYRIKLHDKKPVLDALARHLGLLPPLKTGSHDEEQLDEDEDPREFLIREVDRLAAEEAEGPGDPGVER